MAEMTNGREPGAEGRAAEGRRSAELTPAVPGARAVRVSLAPTMAAGEDVEPITIEPAREPLRMLEASTGKGLLGGIAVDSARGVPAAQPAVEVDGAAAPATLRRLDRERALLVPLDGSAPRQVLLVPAEPGAGPAGPAGSAGPGAGGLRREVVVDGWRVEVEIESAARAALRERARRGRAEAGHSGPTEVHAIIPGVVVAVSVAPGDDVVAGQQLLAVEAMKMQNELRAPRDGTVERVAVSVGRTIEVGDLLLVIA